MLEAGSRSEGVSQCRWPARPGALHGLGWGCRCLRTGAPQEEGRGVLGAPRPRQHAAGRKERRRGMSGAGIHGSYGELPSRGRFPQQKMREQLFHRCWRGGVLQVVPCRRTNSTATDQDVPRSIPNIRQLARSEAQPRGGAFLSVWFCRREALRTLTELLDFCR